MREVSHLGWVSGEILFTPLQNKNGCLHELADHEIVCPQQPPSTEIERGPGPIGQPVQVWQIFLVDGILGVNVDRVVF